MSCIDLYYATYEIEPCDAKSVQQQIIPNSVNLEVPYWQATHEVN